MFSPKKHRNIRKKADVEDVDPVATDMTDMAETTDPATPTAGSTLDSKNGTPDSAAKVKKVKKKPTNTVLSFGDDEQDAEETFKVKKSSASRRLAQNKSRDVTTMSEASSTTDSPVITSRATPGSSTSYSKEALEELRKSTMSTTPSTRYQSDQNMDEEKFTTPLGAPTIIPDAQAIHLAKKKREQMRLRNDTMEEEFIALAGGDDNTVVEQRDARLVREDDDDLDDGEADLERVMGDKLALGSKAQRLAEKSRRDERREMMEDMVEDEEEEEETREWELQQIRNAGIIKHGPKKARETRSSVPVHRSIAFPAASPIPTMLDVKRRLESQLRSLREQHSMHLSQLSQVRREEADIALSAVDAEEAMSKAGTRYTFFQELRSYCRNLAAFFEEKFPELEKIESDYRDLLARRSKQAFDRRKDDMKDDLSEFARVEDDAGSRQKDSQDESVQELDEFGRSIGSSDPNVAKRRRQSERERRHAIRSKQRNDSEAPSSHSNTHDGLATDDELGSGDSREFVEAVSKIENRRLDLFNDVGEDFRDIEAVKHRFQAWKTEYHTDYNKAYGGLLLPIVFDFFVRQETCLWNPFKEQQDLPEYSWHKVISSYTIVHSMASHMYDDSDKEDEEEDMDKDLISKVVAKSLCPLVTNLIRDRVLDLYSEKQTRYFKEALDQLMDYVDKSNNKMEQLLKATLQIVLETAQAHRDQFIQAAQPLTPRHILTAQGHESRERYLWRSIGLFRNLMMLRRFLPSASIDGPVVDGILHDCILRLLDGDDKDTVAKYQMIFHALPQDIRSQTRHLMIDRMAKNM
ncbi:hypothetical protein BGW38_002317 [Lunasporangiospora selenospora]|uniref:GCF C-terminal domain-containing protein n=1 Tax=Lunasporangiospora selenospora TaxID=979761 RepID=A0A9P6G1N9_9FUNG|nr:hypothetical protein BGW38_002317 [Lunasporangiospora selenospora]